VTFPTREKMTWKDATNAVKRFLCWKSSNPMFRWEDLEDLAATAWFNYVRGNKDGVAIFKCRYIDALRTHTGARCAEESYMRNHMHKCLSDYPTIMRIIERTDPLSNADGCRATIIDEYTTQEKRDYGPQTVDMLEELTRITKTASNRVNLKEILLLRLLGYTDLEIGQRLNKGYSAVSLNRKTFVSRNFPWLKYRNLVPTGYEHIAIEN